MTHQKCYQNKTFITNYREEFEIFVVEVVGRQLKCKAIASLIHHCKLQAFFLIDHRIV